MLGHADHRDMPQALSLDLRKRILEATAQGQSHRSVAERFAVGKSSVSRLVDKYATTQSLQPGKPSGRKATLQPEHWKALQEQIASHPNVTVPELTAWLEKTFAIKLTLAAVHDNLKRAGYTYKKRQWWHEREASNDETSFSS